MSQLEREPGEAIVDPWVVERKTFVALERDAIVAGAHLLRYGDDDRVGESYRGVAEIRWLVCKHDAAAAGDALAAACIETMDAWAQSGSTPTDRSRHPSSTASRCAGRTSASCTSARGSRTTVASRSSSSPEWRTCRGRPRRRCPASSCGGRSARGLASGRCWTTSSVGFIELETYLAGPANLSRVGWADVCNLCVRRAGPPARRRDVAARPRRRVAAARRSDPPRLVHVARAGGLPRLPRSRRIPELVRTERGWQRGMVGDVPL